MNSAVKNYATSFVDALLHELILERRSRFPQITRKELAEFLEIDPASAMRLENGESDLSIERFIHICGFLKLDPVTMMNKAAIRVAKIKSKKQPE